MPQTIQQSVTLPATPARLFAMYLDPILHAAITGAPVTISPEPGATFHAFDGALSGTMRYTAPQRLIVQTWRSNQKYYWKPW